MCGAIFHICYEHSLIYRKQLQQIIKRAAELEQSAKEGKPPKEGLSEEEILSIAQEVGLNMQHVQTAILEQSEQAITRHSGFSDTHIFEEREVKSSLPEEVIWEEIKAELRHNFGTGDTFGAITEHPSQKEWSHKSLSGIETIASLAKRPQGFKIRISQRVGLASSLTEGVMYGGILSIIAFSIIFAALKPSFYEGSALFASLLVVSSILVYTLDVAWRKKKLKGLTTMFDKITPQFPSLEASRIKDSVASSERIQIKDQDKYSSEIKEPNSTKLIDKRGTQ